MDSRRAAIALLVVILVSLACRQEAGAGLSEWTTAGPERGWIHALTVDPRTQGVVYAGTNRGVFKSADGGASWNPGNAGLDGFGDLVNALAIDQIVGLVTAPYALP